MTIARLTEFQAKPGNEDELKAFLDDLAPAITLLDGCMDCYVLRHQEDRSRFIVYEVWESVEHHAASVKNIPPDLLQKAMTLLAGMPKGEYWEPA